MFTQVKKKIYLEYKLIPSLSEWSKCKELRKAFLKSISSKCQRNTDTF